MSILTRVTGRTFNSRRFCVYGAGAIGGTIAALLVRAGASVSVVARGKTLAVLKRHGLCLLRGGTLLQVPVRASAEPAELGPQDYVIIAVKATALPDVAVRISPLLGRETSVVTAMNGVPWWFFANDNGPLAGRCLTAVDPEGAIGRAIPVSSVIACVIYMSCALEAPGIVRLGPGRRLFIGEANGGSTPRLARLADWLRLAGLDCTESPHIRHDIWFKLWTNLSANPISMLTAATMDRIVGDPMVRDLCVRMMEEAARVGNAIGIPPTVKIGEMIERAQALGAFKTSMLQDAERGTPVEIDALLTVTHDIGRMAGVPTPFIDSVLGLARLRAASTGLLAVRPPEAQVAVNDA